MRVGINNRNGERAKGDGDADGHGKGENTHLTSLLIAEKKTGSLLSRMKVDSMFEGI